MNGPLFEKLAFIGSIRFCSLSGMRCCRGSFALYSFCIRSVYLSMPSLSKSNPALSILYLVRFGSYSLRNRSRALSSPAALLQVHEWACRSVSIYRSAGSLCSCPDSLFVLVSVRSGSRYAVRARMHGSKRSPLRLLLFDCQCYAITGLFLR